MSIIFFNFLKINPKNLDEKFRLGLDGKTAAEDACRIEHVVSAKSFKAIKDHIMEGNELP